MGTIELREKLIHLINTADEQYLESLSYLVESKKVVKGDIVAYTVQGEPLTKEMYVKKVKKTEASVKAGNFTTIEDLEKEVENW